MWAALGFKKAEDPKDTKDDTKTAAAAAAEQENQVQQEIEVEMTLVADKTDSEKGGLLSKKTALLLNQPSDKYSKKIDECYKPIIYMLMITGRFPLKRSVNTDRSWNFKASLCSLSGFYFIFTSLLSLYTLFIGTFNLMDVMLDLTNASVKNNCARQSWFELALFDRNIVSFAVIWSTLCQFTLETINIFYKRRYFAKYLLVWKAAADTMQIDVAAGVRRQTLILMGIFGISGFTLILMSLLKLSAIVVGGPALTTLLMFRLYIPCMLTRINREFTKDFLTARIIGGIILIFFFVGSQIIILLFMMACKMLKNAFKVWNERFKKAILRSNVITFQQSVAGRTTYELLFKDHCILLDLIEGTDRFFSTIIEFYCSLQIVNIILQIYFVIRAAKYGDKHSDFLINSFFIRPNDWIPGIIFLALTILMVVLPLKAAAEVGEVAMEGLEVIRTRTMLGRKTEDELYFMLSMFSSYTVHKKLDLRGGGYVNLDKDLMILVLATTMTYFIIIAQFEPTFDYDFSLDTFSNQTINDTLQYKRQEIGIFLRDLEGLKDEHWTKK